MELSFVIKALQRRWWVIVLFSLLGAIPGSLIDTSDDSKFESVALVFVSPPSDGEIVFVNDPDRYVQGQLTVLQSLALAQEVAAAIGDESAAAVVGNTNFRQITDTDIVALTAKATTPERAQLIAQTYIDLYIANETARASEAQQPDIELFNAELEALEAELAEVNQFIETELIPYTAGNRAAPDLVAIVPAAAAQRELLVDEIRSVQAAKNELELVARQRATSQIVQNASFPTAPIESSNSVFIVGGYIMGAMLGVVVALMWAQFSPYVIDEVSTTEVTGQPVVGSLSRSRTLRNTPLLAAQQGRNRIGQTLSQLAVRSEALGSVDRPLVVVCIGPRRGAGATTLSLAMAGRFAQQGSLVTLLDADDRDRTLSLRHGDPDAGGLSELIACVDSGADVEPDRILSSTDLQGVSVIAQGEEVSMLRRANAEAVVETANQFGDVLIIDGGPLLGSAAVIEACHHADAVVLAIPLQKQLRGQLEDAVQQLGPDRGKLLTVANEPVGSGFFSNLFDRS